MKILIRARLSWVVYLFCFTGCSIQIYDLTRLYLEYKVRHEVTYDYADQTELPTIDIVIPMVMAINLTELFIRYPEQMTEICQMLTNKRANHTIDSFNSECVHEVKKDALTTSEDLVSFIKVKDINELTIDPRDQIDYIQIGNANVTTDKCKITRYFNALAVFLRVSCTEQAALITEDMEFIGSYGRKIATIGHSFGPYFGIRFTSQFDMPGDVLSKYFMVASKSNEMTYTWVLYEKIVSHSLPYPYKTNCRYYNRMQALYNCTLNHSLHKGIMFRNMLNEWGSLPEHLVFGSHGRKLPLIIDECAQWTPVTECDKTIYFINGKIISKQVDTNLSGLIFIPQPLTPIIYYSVYPELLLSEYFIFVGSIVGTWFGYSIFHRFIRKLPWIKSKVAAKIRKSQRRDSPIKLFTIRNSYNFSNPLLHSTPHSSRFSSSYSSINTIKKFS